MLSRSATFLLLALAASPAAAQPKCEFIPPPGPFLA
jgi:hypothetical protein